MKALFRSTWWLWPSYAGVTVALALWFDAAFLWLLPVFFLVFVYFAYVRFDDQGNRRELGGPS